MLFKTLFAEITFEVEVYLVLLTEKHHAYQILSKRCHLHRNKTYHEADKNATNIKIKIFNQIHINIHIHTHILTYYIHTDISHTSIDEFLYILTESKSFNRIN